MQDCNLVHKLLVSTRKNQIIKNYIFPHFTYYGVGNTGILLAPQTKCVILTPNNMLIKQESFGPISIQQFKSSNSHPMSLNKSENYLMIFQILQQECRNQIILHILQKLLNLRHSSVADSLFCSSKQTLGAAANQCTFLSNVFCFLSAAGVGDFCLSDEISD